MVLPTSSARTRPTVHEAKRLKALERENAELKKMLGESLLKNRVLEAGCERSSELGRAPGTRQVAGEGRCPIDPITAYKKAALWDDVQRWFDGGAPATGLIKPEASVVHTFRQGGGSSWSVYPPRTPREEKVPLAWKSFATSFTPNPITFGYRWNEQMIRCSTVEQPSGPTGKEVGAMRA